MRGLSRTSRRPPSFYDRADILQAHWFGDIVVHAGRDAFLAVALHCVCRHSNDDNRRLVVWELRALLLALPNKARHLQPAHFGHHDVHEDQIVWLPIERGERFHAIGRQVGTIAHLLEQADGDLLVDDIVVAKENA